MVVEGIFIAVVALEGATVLKYLVILYPREDSLGCLVCWLEAAKKFYSVGE